MGLNDFSSHVDAQEEGAIPMPNVSEQISEAYKRQVKKGARKTKKTRKDEKKAKKQDILLAKFLVKILVDKRYDVLFPNLFKSFDAGVPSNFILGIMSLVYVEISDTIRKNVGKPPLVFTFTSEELIRFSGENLPSQVKNRINAWVEDVNAIVLLNPSEVYFQRIMDAIEDSEELYIFSVQVFTYFLEQINIYISESLAHEYIVFIFKKILFPKMK